MDTIRHFQIFDSSKFFGSVHIIGLGSVGSSLALEIAKLGIQNIYLSDFDKIERHNIPNQILYGPKDVGKYKVRRAFEMLKELTGVEAEIQETAITKNKLQNKVVALCVDSMKAREQIFNNCILPSPTTRFMIDIRISAKTIYVFAVDVKNYNHVNEYKNTLHPDEDVPIQEGNCTITQNIGATAHLATSLATWMFIDWSNNQLEHNEIIFRLQDYTILKRKFLAF